MYCFIKVDIPYSVLDGSEGAEVSEWYDMIPSDSWTEIQTTAGTTGDFKRLTLLDWKMVRSWMGLEDI